MNEKRIEELNELQKIILYDFKDIATLNQSLTHKSFDNENPSYGGGNNERLEFLGDSVLDLIISEYLYKTFPNYEEGELSKMRASVVNEFQLAKLARNIELGRFILLGRGEELTGGRNKDSILANTYEALIAGIFLDGGIDPAEKFVNSQFHISLMHLNNGMNSYDYKTKLQEVSQERFKRIPEYEIVSEVGPDHEKFFSARVIIDSKIFGFGIGKSKKEAHQRAAEEALNNILKEINGDQ